MILARSAWRNLCKPSRASDFISHWISLPSATMYNHHFTQPATAFKVSFFFYVSCGLLLSNQTIFTSFQSRAYDTWKHNKTTDYKEMFCLLVRLLLLSYLWTLSEEACPVCPHSEGWGLVITSTVTREPPVAEQSSLTTDLSRLSCVPDTGARTCPAQPGHSDQRSISQFKPRDLLWRHCALTLHS